MDSLFIFQIFKEVFPMKQKVISLVLVVFMVLSALVGLTSCDDEQTPVTPACVQGKLDMA